MPFWKVDLGFPLIIALFYSTSMAHMKTLKHHFRFEDFWLHYREVHRVVERAWMKASSYSSPFAKLNRCFRRTKAALTWMIGKRLRTYLLKRKRKSRNCKCRRKNWVSYRLTTRLSSLSTSRTHLLVQQECYWRQRARINWLTQLW